MEGAKRKKLGTPYSPAKRRMSMYVVEPMNRITTAKTAVPCQLCSSRDSKQHLHARPATENRIKAMYPLTVLCAPLSDALPVAVLQIRDQPRPNTSHVAQRTYTMMAARSACDRATVSKTDGYGRTNSTHVR